MTCVRCGRCCFYIVPIISPKYINEDINLEELNISDIPEDMFTVVDGVDTFCPYLAWDDKNDQAVCKIHNKPWFKQTPCSRHNNPDYCSESSECRIGPFIINDEKTFSFWKNEVKRHQIGDNSEYI